MPFLGSIIELEITWKSATPKSEETDSYQETQLSSVNLEQITYWSHRVVKHLNANSDKLLESECLLS